MNDIKIFEKEEFGQIRVAGTSDNPLFCAADICKALGYSNNRKAIADHCDEGDVTKRDTPTKGGLQSISYVTESGMYALVFGSKLKSAKQFKKWVTSEVLPSIRKTGIYSIENLSRKQLAQMVLEAEEEKEYLQLELQKADEQYDALEERNAKLSKRLRNSDKNNSELKNENKWRREVNIKLKDENLEIKIENRQLKTELDEAAPKVECYDDILASKGLIDMKDLANVLSIKGVGRNNLFKVLRGCGLLMSDNRPYQEYKDRGYFDVELVPFSKGNGKREVYVKTLACPRGIDYIRKRVKEYLNIK